MAFASDIAAAPSGLQGRIASLRATMQRKIEKRRIYSRTLNELGSLSDRELADLGISRGQIRFIAREAAEKEN